MSSVKLPEWALLRLTKLEKLSSPMDRHKSLLDFGENFLMLLSGYALGEYHSHRIVDMKLERELYARLNDLNSGKSVSVGHYCSLVQKASQAIENAEKDSVLKKAFAFNKRDKKALQESVEFTQVRDVFLAAKEYAENKISDPLVDFFERFQSNQPSLRANLIDYLLVFPQIRNRFAHPHYDIRNKKTGEVLGKVEWPLGEAYYNLVNPIIEASLIKALEITSTVWGLNRAKVDTVQNTNVSMLAASGSFVINQPDRPFKSGMEFILGDNNAAHFCCDFNYNLFVDSVAEKTILEEEGKREQQALHAKNKEQLSDLIKENLSGDGVIDLDEYNLLKAVAVNNLEMSEDNLKEMISSVASSMNIQDPFPEIDPIYISKIDEALQSGNLNRLKLKLEGERFGVEASGFDSILQERCEFLDLDILAIGANEDFTLSNHDLKATGILVSLSRWLQSLSILNQASGKVSLYTAVKGNTDSPYTKEHIHQHLWLDVTSVLQGRLSALSNSSHNNWIVAPNRWNLGRMCGYYWASMYPDDRKDGKSYGKTIHFSFVMGVEEGRPTVSMGLMNAHDKVNAVEHFPLFEAVLKKKIGSFFRDYSKELSAYKDFGLGTCGRRYNLSDLNGDFESLFRFHVSVAADAGTFSVNYGDLADFFEGNPYKILELFDVTYSFMSNLLEDVHADYKVRSIEYVSPFRNMARKLERITNDLSSVVEQYAGANPKQNRNSNSSRYYDYLHSKRRFGFNTAIEFGVWIDTDATSSLVGFRLRAWDDKFGDPQCLRLMDEFDTFTNALSLKYKMDEDPNYCIESGFIAYHLKLTCDGYEESLADVMAELDRILAEIQAAPLDILNINNRASEEDTKNRDQYFYNEETYLKGRLVLAVIKNHAKENPDLTVDDLAEVFPQHLNGSFPVICSLSTAAEKYGNKRHYIKEPIQLIDAVVVVTNQWGIANIDGFLGRADELGITIEALPSKDSDEISV